MKFIDGIQKIYYSIIGAEGTHGACKLLSDKVVEFGVSPNQAVTPLYGSNNENAKLRGIKKAETTMTLNGVETSVVEEILGMIALEGGGYADCGSDRPYIAIQAELSLTEGGMQYLTLFKGQFEDYEIGSKTKKDDAPEVATVTLVGSFAPFEVEGFEEPVLKTVVKSDDAGFKAADYVGQSAKWGKSIILPVKKTVTP